MRAGPMRALVKFERRTATDRRAGVIRGGWLPLCGPFSAQKRPIRGFEQAAAARLGGREVCEFWLRGCAEVEGVLQSDRLVDARNTDLVYDITSIENPDQRGRDYVFTCERGGSSG